MTLFERTYLCALPFLPALYGQVRRRLRGLVRRFGPHCEVLDVGGRKSPYSIGVGARVTISDLPRISETQKQLNLGVTGKMVHQTLARRSNVRAIIFDDMTHSHLPDNSFDCVVSVEVLEHVTEDQRFVHEVARVLRPGGVFLMTTPNGEFVPNHNPDHKRHYRRDQLAAVLTQAFDDVDVEYGVQAGRWAALGYRSWSLKRPLRTLLSMLGNLINGVLSSRAALKQQSHGTCHLIAVAAKAPLGHTTPQEACPVAG